MASYRGIWRTCLWRCVCVCLLLSAVTSEAATRKIVAPGKISSKAVITGGSASGTADSIAVTGAALEGEYIAADTKNVPVRGIHGGVTSGYRTVATGLKNGLKANLGSLLLQATVGAAVAGVGWVMTDGVLTKKTFAAPSNPPSSNYYWVVGTSDNPTHFNSAELACLSTFKNTSYWAFDHVQFQYDSSALCFAKGIAPNTIGTVYAQNNLTRFGSGCAAPAVWDSVSRSCQVYSSSPVADGDWDALDPWLAKQSAAWLTTMMREICGGSYGTLSPDQCFDSMKTASQNLTGPASVDGGTKTTNSTYTKPDGTTGTRSETQQTTYNITYGPNYWDYSTTTKTVNYEDGVKTGESTETDSSSPTEEQPSEEDEQTTASPCSSNCDGPKYEDLYKPTQDTKEKAIDSYASRVKNIPIINAAAGFFNVSVSASCPVWQTSVDMDVYGRQFHSDLKFDQHCQPWFTDYRPFAVAVVLIIAALGAFWVATLD